MPKLEMATETRLIVEFLKRAPDRFTFEELLQLTGLNDMVRLRGYLMTALRRARRMGIWYESERGVGYRRLLKEEDKNTSQTSRIKKVKRHVGRIDTDQDYVNFDLLSQDGKITFTVNSTVIGSLKAAASLSRRRQVTRAVTNGQLADPKPVLPPERPRATPQMEKPRGIRVAANGQWAPILSKKP